MRVVVAVWLGSLAGCADRPLQLPESEPADLAVTDSRAGTDGAAVDLRAVDLRGADLRGADLRGADLRGVDLAGVDLRISDLLGADLRPPSHCGDNDVLVGTACVKRSCQAGDGRLNCLLPDGGIGNCAGATCSGIDFLTDPNNCGFPGGVCAPGTPCTNGFCYGGCTPGSCPAGLSCDSGDSFGGCALPSCDGAHDYQVCRPLSSNQPDFASQCCGKSCTHLLSDNQNCGTCGHVCPGGAACHYGVCDVDCTRAIDDTPCSSGEGYCCQGACVFNGTGCGCGVSCFPSCATTPCPSSFSCVRGGFGGLPVCARTSCAGLAEGQVCATHDADGAPQAGSCCGGSCAVIGSDARNCGACGRHCPAGEICLNAECVPPVACADTSDSSPCALPSGVVGACCAGSCVDVHTDDLNCGGCAQACPTGLTCHAASAVFGNGQCQDGAGVVQPCSGALPCPAGYTCSSSGLCQPSSCSGRADGTPCASGECCNGACLSLSDLSSCGSCGRACPVGSTDCFAGTCASSVYDPLPCSSTAPCPDGNTCIGVTCPMFWPNWCAPHQCFPSSCAGRSDGVACAFGPNTPGTCCAGACVSTDRDPAHCGQCGRDCGGGLCAAGTCLASAVTRCVPDCPDGTLCYEVGPFDGGFRLGVCVGPVCGLITYNNPQLNSGRCLAQDGQLGLCCSDGTCADIASDRANCGECGVSCGGADCVNGSCAGAACDYAHEGGFCGTAGQSCVRGRCQ